MLAFALSVLSAPATPVARTLAAEDAKTPCHQALGVCRKEAEEYSHHDKQVQKFERNRKEAQCVADFQVCAAGEAGEAKPSQSLRESAKASLRGVGSIFLKSKEADVDAAALNKLLEGGNECHKALGACRKEAEEYIDPSNTNQLEHTMYNRAVMAGECLTAFNECQEKEGKKAATPIALSVLSAPAAPVARTPAAEDALTCHEKEHKCRKKAEEYTNHHPELQQFETKLLEVECDENFNKCQEKEGKKAASPKREQELSAHDRLKAQRPQDGANASSVAKLVQLLRGGGKCPQGSPGGVLFNHVSKTGGTGMKGLLQEALAITPTIPEVTARGYQRIMQTREPISKNDKRVADRYAGAYVIQDDTQDIQVTAQDAANFFVIGLVRRPCDFLVSAWQYMQHVNNDEDHSKFAEWIWNPNMPQLLSGKMQERYGDVDHNVHCMVRTHAMSDDLKKCMLQYQACGGEYDERDLSDDRVGRALRHGESGTHSRKTGGTCETFFNSTMMTKVMKTESSLISKYDLDSCCSK